MIFLEGNQIWSPIHGHSIPGKFLPAANDFTVKMLPRLSVRNFFIDFETFTLAPQLHLPEKLLSVIVLKGDLYYITSGQLKYLIAIS